MKKHNHQKITFFIAIILSAAVLTHSKTHPSDIKFLSLFKQSIHPSSIHPGSCLSTWTFNLDPCDSLFSSHFTCGLRCDTVDPTTTNLSRVTDITLDSANYTGRLYCTNLPYLQTLELPDNLIAGPIPSSLSNLPSLRRLILSRNSFSHPIPPSLSSLTHLTQLSLDGNQLTGPVPSTLNSLTSLTRLELQHNRLSHPLPDLSALRSLTSLDISDNHRIKFSPSVSHLPDSLVSLSARNNTLTGHHNIPVIDQLHKLPYLQVLDLSYNRLSGSISSLLFQHQSLQQISLSHNRLSSLDIPTNRDQIRNSRLIAVDLSYNKLTGPLPDFFTEMPALSALSLEYNRFGGPIPPQYAQKVKDGADGGDGGTTTGSGTTASFHRLLLGGNYLLGPIPGPILQIKPGSVTVSLVDNCLLFCPESLFFCQGGVQKPLTVCRRFLRRPVH